ncbi:MAG: hypothetical protein Q7T32_07710 [Moraxellaceae bacterium]|nr:hypothetical protein [Moraxellaceae bacterium]
MKHATRLILASSIAMSASAFGLESLEDETLSEMTGQDGITVTYTPAAGGVSFSTILHDADPVVDGAIVIGNPLSAAGHTATSITTPVGQSIVMLVDATGDIDAGTAGSQAALQINISIPANTVINTGSISAAQSNGLGNAVTNQTGVIMDNISITLGASSLLMTLGNEAPGGQMIRVTTSMAAGLNIANFALKDANGGGTGGSGFRASNILLDNSGASAALDVDFKIDLVPTGVQTSVVTFGTGGTDIKITGLRLGDSAASSIGNVDVVGLNLSGSMVTVAGH